MKFLTTSLYGAAVVALALAVSPAHATAITGTNLDFEANVGLTPNTDQHIEANTGTISVPGWIIDNTSGTGDAGTWAPASVPLGSNFITQTWQGNQAGFLEDNSNISQNLNGTYTGNAGTVTVSLLLGDALLHLQSQTNTITLLAGGLPLATETLGPPIPGFFIPETYTFNVGANPLMTGDTFGLEFANLNDPGYLYIDNITIDGGLAVIPTGGGGSGGGSSVPEPASLSILAVALLGFAAWRRKGSGGGAALLAA